MKNSITFIFSLLIVSCSSLPEVTVSVGPDEQAATIRFEQGNSLLRQGSAEEAKTLFEQAYMLFTGIDNARGKIRSALGLARIYALTGNQQEAYRWEKLATGWAKSWHPESEQYVILYKTENFYRTGLIDSVLRLTALQLNPVSYSVKWQLKAYRILATTDQKQLNSLLESVESDLESVSEKDLAGQEDPAATAFCWYSIGYGWFASGKYDRALNAYRQAASIDRQLENKRSLADAVFGEAQSLRQLNRLGEAEIAFFRAWEMYEQSGFVSLAEQARFSGLELKYRRDPSTRVELEQLLRSTKDIQLQNKIRSRFFGQQ